MSQIGLYIGRFQPFHNGHKSVIDTMLQENTHNVILIGVTENDSIIEETNQDSENPFPLYVRLYFLRETYGNREDLHLYPLFDMPSDEDWIESILEILNGDTNTGIKIYCGDIVNDSVVQVIKKHISLFKGRKIEFREISRNILPISGTEIREDIENNETGKLKSKVPESVFEKIIKK